MRLLNPLTIPRGDRRYVKKVSWQRVVFTVATIGQTVFTLPSVAFDPNTYKLAVNGVEYDRLTHYLVSGTTLTWLNLFTLAVGDRVTVAYQL